METATETTQAADSVVEGLPVNQSVTENVADNTQADTFDPSKIDPKVSDYFEKKYSDYVSVKSELAGLKEKLSSPELQRVLNPQPQQPQFEVTQEDYQAALADPRKFQELVFRINNHSIQTQVIPLLAQAQHQAQVNRAETRLMEVVKQYPEFEDFHKRGLIEPILKKYGNIDFADALAIAKVQSGWVDQEADRRSKGLVDKRKAAITEKPGNVSYSKSRNRFKNREQAMEYVMSEARKGRQVDADELEIG